MSTLRGCRGDRAEGTSLQRQQEGWGSDTGKLSAGRTRGSETPAKVTEFLFLETSKEVGDISAQ